MGKEKRQKTVFPATFYAKNDKNKQNDNDF
jgi:hypothetical protein